MSEEKLELKQASAVEQYTLFTSDTKAVAAIQDVSLLLPPPIMGIVQSYAADDYAPLDVEGVSSLLPSHIMGIIQSYAADDYAPLDRIVRGTRGFFPREFTVYDFLYSIPWEPEQVVFRLSKYPELLLQKVPELKLPGGDILLDACLLDVMHFWLDGPMFDLVIEQVIMKCPEEYITSVAAQCRKMQGGGTDLVKMTQDPRAVDFTQLVMHDDITYPLLQNNDGLVLCKNKLFYVTQSQFVEEIDEGRIPAELKEEFIAFKAELNEMEDNTGKRSSTPQHELIKRALGITLERNGIRYQREGIEYQDTQVGMELGIAYRRYIRLCNTHAKETPWDNVNQAWLTIGWKQRQSIPMLQWICEEKSFYPLPAESNFKQGPFKRTLQFKNLNIRDKKCSATPFDSREGLGIDLALYKGHGGPKPRALGARNSGGSWVAGADLAAICRIVKVEKSSITECADKLQALALSRHGASPR